MNLYDLSDLKGSSRIHLSHFCRKQSKQRSVRKTATGVVVRNVCTHESGINTAHKDSTRKLPCCSRSRV